MTDIEEDLGQLPATVHCTQAFMARLPSQRIIDAMRKLEPDFNFGELFEAQAARVMAFRALVRDYPRRDTTSLWLHAYDVEVAIEDVDPTSERADALAAFCAYYHINPLDVDALPDITWDAMVRLMQREASAIRAEQAKLPKR